MLQAGSAARQNRESGSTLDEPGRDGERAEAPTVKRADQRHGEGLHGHRNRHHRHFDVGRQGQEQRTKHDCAGLPGKRAIMQSERAEGGLAGRNGDVCHDDVPGWMEIIDNCYIRSIIESIFLEGWQALRRGNGDRQP